MFERYKKINQKTVYKLKWYMERFNISDVYLCDDSLKEKVVFLYIRSVLNLAGVRVHNSSAKCLKGVKNSLFVASREKLKNVAENGCYGMITSDFVNLFALEDDRLVDKTQVYSTLENSYASLCVVGDSEFAKEMQQYYLDNHNIDVRIFDRKCITFSNGRYHIDAEPVSEDEELIVVLDPIPQFPLFYGDSEKEANVFFVNNMFRNFYKPVETYKKDIAYILGKLQNNGVTVVTVCSVDYDDFKSDKELVATIDSWNKLRHEDSEKFNEKRHEVRGTKHLLANQKNLTHSYAKGYSQMHGNGEYINFLNGFRITTGNKAEAPHDVYMFGACVVRDLGADDDNTLASLIKKEIGDDYNVHNYGSEIHATNLIMRTLDYKPGDVVIWWSLDNIKKQNKIFPDNHYCDLTAAYRRVPELHKHVFDDINHYDRTVKNEIVKEIVTTVKTAIEFDNINNGRDGKLVIDDKVIAFGRTPKRIPGKILNTDNAFIEYLEGLEQKRVPGKNGAVVMNCNPFTLGHRYLIETAASQVDHLYVFVVEEDKSIFKFEDRIEMVRRGTSDLGNVTVLPSGKYFASAQTLPGYFMRSELKDTYLNASDDIELFVQTADALGISVRFMGEEPIDVYTRQYNENMARILPKYGLKLVIIPRKTDSTDSDVVISASRVRKYLDEKNYDAIRDIVPETTYGYLKEELHLINE